MTHTTSGDLFAWYNSYMRCEWRFDELFMLTI